MASGHVNRANRPNTWLHRPALQVKKTLASREPSTHGTTRKNERARSMSGSAPKAAIVMLPRQVREVPLTVSSTAAKEHLIHRCGRGLPAELPTQAPSRS
jgi:hypothetical protein